MTNTEQITEGVDDARAREIAEREAQRAENLERADAFARFQVKLAVLMTEVPELTESVAGDRYCNFGYRRAFEVGDHLQAAVEAAGVAKEAHLYKARKDVEIIEAAETRHAEERAREAAEVAALEARESRETEVMLRRLARVGVKLPKGAI